MPLVKTLKEKSPEEREEKALEEGVPEGEIIYRSVRQDGKYTLEEYTSGVGLVASLAHVQHAPDE